MGAYSGVAPKHGRKGGEKKIKAAILGVVIALGCSYQPSRATVGFDAASTASQMWRGPAPMQPTPDAGMSDVLVVMPDALAAAPDVLAATPDALAATPDARLPDALTAAADALAAAPDTGWPACVVSGSLYLASLGDCVDLPTVKCYVGHFGHDYDPTVKAPCQSNDWYDGVKWQTIPLYLVPSCALCPKSDGGVL